MVFPGSVIAGIVRSRLLLGAILAAGVGMLFLPTVQHEFLTYDDPAYVTQNAHVTSGLTWAGVRWAFTSIDASNWHPLTWLSHMLDCELFGLWPGGHHLTNTILHALNTALLFLAFARLTGRIGPSLFVAALFGIHPLHVESVAWIAERKDVLSTTLFLLVLWVYAIRAERERRGLGGRGALFAAALVLFAFGLMAKPMLVTVPFVLALLDVWPLRRWQDAGGPGRWRLAWEKVPFLLLSAASSVLTMIAQRGGGAVGSIEEFTLPVRLANAVLAYARYLGKCFFPDDLAVFYPSFAQMPPLASVFGAGLLLAVLTVLAVASLRRHPWGFVGWFWFTGMLVPVIGLVQVGGQTIADRYTYVPLIGVFVIVAWSVDTWARGRVRWRFGTWVAGSLVVAVLAALTSRQLGLWRTNEVLFRHTAAVTKDNWVAHYNLFLALRDESPEEAQAELREMVRILSDFARRYDHRGVELAREPGREEEAILQFRTAIRIMRDLPEPHYHLGMLLARQPENRREAAQALVAAARLKPDWPEPHFALGSLLARHSDNVVAAEKALRRAIELRSGFAEARHELGLLLMSQPGRAGEAIEQFERVLELDPRASGVREQIDRLRTRVP